MTLSHKIIRLDIPKGNVKFNPLGLLLIVTLNLFEGLIGISALAAKTCNCNV